MEGFATSVTSWLGSMAGVGINSLMTVLGVVSDSWNAPNLEEYIRQHGYPVEAHEITSAEGYILTYHRIPHGKGQPNPNVKRKPVLLQHGLLQSSADWVLLPTSLGYLLADEGLDVWIGNARGNAYSRRHVSLNPDKDKKKFWNFSWHEMGYYDLPAAIDYILQVTNQDQLLYSGFSMGTTMFFVLGATRPEYMAKVQAAALMAPIAYAWNIPSPVINIAKKMFLYKPKFFYFMYELLPLSKNTRWLHNKICDAWLIKRLSVCEDLLKLVVGFHRENIKRVPMSLITKFFPAGTSFKTVEHFRQIIENDFSQYDYGAKTNLIRYGSKSPPTYNISRVTAPLYIHYGHTDWLSVPKDVHFLVKHLPNVKNVREVPEPLFNHMDFFYAVETKPLLYDNIVATFSKLAIAAPGVWNNVDRFQTEHKGIKATLREELHGARGLPLEHRNKISTRKHSRNFTRNHTAAKVSIK